VTHKPGFARHPAQHLVGGDEEDQKKCLEDNIKKWTKLPLARTLRAAEDGDGWRKIVKLRMVLQHSPNG